jgi:type I restriction enzyme S subunit
MLGELTVMLSGGTPSKSNPSYWQGTVPWASAKDMKKYFLADTEDHISDEAVQKATKLVPAGTVLLLTRGMTLLDDVPICLSMRPMTFNQDVKAVRSKNGLLQEYLPYLLLGHKADLLDLVDLAGHGTGRLNSDELKNLPVLLPPESEQSKIAQFLGTVDNRLYNLSRQNESIEAIAQAIFKSWFVDFDPVRAKAEGREPEGMDAATAALFPSTFEDSELGLIPQGWTTGPITNVLSLNPTRSLKKKVAATYLDMASVPTSGPRATSWIKRDFVSGSKFINGDTLLARITPCLENGKTAYVDFLEQDEVGWGSTEFIVMATKPNVPSQFAYLLARDPEFRQYAIQSMSGTSGRQRVQVDQLAMFKIAIANDSIYRAFGTLVEPLFQRIKYSSEEQTTLTALRDTLLPRLISGKLRVPEAEAMLMEVV